MNLKTTAKTALNAAVENKVSGPVIKTLAVPPLVACFVGGHIAMHVRTTREIRAAKKNGTL